jgi:glucose-6-phosphate isomerase
LNASTRGQKILFQDNLSQGEVLFHAKDLKNIGIIALSKSGETLETLLEVQGFIDRFKKHHLSLPHHFIIATAPRDTSNKENHTDDNSLMRIARTHSIPTMDLSSDIDGRFSLFSNTGYILSSLMEFDMHAFRQGALNVLAYFSTDHIHDIHTLFTNQHTLDEHVLWTYDERLLPLVAWWAQLIGESLGKEGGGLTPVIAVGPRDQHSQLQLYLGGPHNKFFTFLYTSRHYETMLKRSQMSPIKDGKEATFFDLDDLKKIAIGDVIGLQMHAVMEALTEEKINNRLVYVDMDDPFSLGQVCMRIILEVWILGFLRGIDPFGQPDIEKVKQKVWDLLKRV